MLASATHHDLIALVLEVVVALELLYDGILERIDTADGRVLGEAVHNGVDGSPLDVCGRVKVGLARTKAHNVQALALRAFSLAAIARVADGFRETAR